ncbi:hypothetical protein ALQ69_04265, partial [Pseudomonas savastanoi pv. glycinea]
MFRRCERYKQALFTTPMHKIEDVMSKQILILPGDGIGPEIMTEAVKVLELANEKYQLGFELTHDVIGGAAIDKHGVPLA